ncbi:hypothetical protein [Sandarakinorhabdus sp.]|uniref:hypothetical protein n=1 Tax=Sandarakinorhabdus sp. TaxID=1916663 RepID=UPI00286DB485|nr:hypothetical protein [Sandarakinorhabdus sp.]
MNESASTTYRGLLVEIKYRTEAISAVLNKEVPLRAKIAEELCYLQLRMICELIAIGCLVIHGSMKPKADLYTTHKADYIIKNLSRLHPKFFPVPLEAEDIIEDGIPSWVHKTTGFLTQTDLVNLWNRHAGGALHRGHAKNILENDRPLKFAEITGWRDKIIALLNRHIIASPDEQTICYFIMNDGNNQVHSALFEQIELPSAR